MIHASDKVIRRACLLGSRGQSSLVEEINTIDKWMPGLVEFWCNQAWIWEKGSHMSMSTRHGARYTHKYIIFFDRDKNLVWCYHSHFTGKKTVAQRSSERLSYRPKVIHSRGRIQTRFYLAPQSIFWFLPSGTAMASLKSGSQNRLGLSVTRSRALIPWLWSFSREDAA